MNYIVLITYSFDSDYVLIPCKTEKEAINIMDKLLTEEIKVVKNEGEYTPSVINYGFDEKVLVYFEDVTIDDDFLDIDHASYRIFDVNYSKRVSKLLKEENE